ncbi:MAG: indolepyruvate ferredoxin oxidoreductase family protein, partial [Pseudomonadota bacterium]
MDGAKALSDTDIASAIPLRDVALSDRFDLAKDTVLLSGIQALIRLPIMQKARDEAAGLNTAGYISGYRGSPLGGVDLTAWKAKDALAKAGVIFEPGLNEDLAATAIWGTQSAHFWPKAKHQGVFGLWYGKGPGLDRTGDVFRHGNLGAAGPHGGVLVAMGDDHTCESSTSCHQTDVTLMDAFIPVLHPAGPQEVLDYGIIGWAMSRATGCWVGIKCLKDTVEATTVVDADPHRIDIVIPELTAPPEGLNAVLGEHPTAQEARLVDYRFPAIPLFARANKLDQRRVGKPGARFGLAASGKNWLDVLQALDYLGIDEAEAERIGLTAYKIGLAYPLDGDSLREFADGLRLMMVVEEKRSFLEFQAKDALYGMVDAPAIVGKKDLNGETLFTQKMDLNPLEIALAIGKFLLELAPGEKRIEAAMARLTDMVLNANAPEIAARLPYFCSGCPHNTSTRVPEGSRGAAGIGCHFMAQWMDRDTLGFTQMGGEGAQWIGESKFTEEEHIFQNLGDGTYNHSGLMAIRAAVASNTNITYKVLYNDAVAMTGGQGNEGDLTPYKVARELLAAGVGKIVAVIDRKEEVDTAKFPPQVEIRERDDLDAVQRDLRQVKGVSAIIYVQTCAAEKRRRRKRGTFPELPERVMINELVCEGCGDCGQKSNCVSILPKETEFGRKRQIDQSSCNKDLSCLNGFCPSFVTLAGAVPKKRKAENFELPDLPDPVVPEIAGKTHNVVVTGVGGTGVVTVGALIGMAAHLEGKGAGVMEMAGLAQKGGAVHIHCRIGRSPSDISAIRVQAGEADSVIGGDLVVAGGAKALGLMARDRTGVVSNSFEIITGDFTKNTEFTLPMERLRLAIERQVGADRARFFNATKLAERLLGDAIYSNVLLLGSAWQMGLLPLSKAALVRAIELNGAGVKGNLQAFEIGRWAIVQPEAVAEMLADRQEAAPVETLDAVIDRRAAFLTDYQDAKWATRYRDTIERLRAAENRAVPGSETLTLAAAKSLFKLMSYKDEYEVARLHSEMLDTQIAERFEGVERITFHLAPPLLSRKGSDGKPRKTRFGPWMKRAFG